MRASLILALVLVACDGSTGDSAGTATSTGPGTSTSTGSGTATETSTATSTGSTTSTGTSTETGTGSDTGSDTATATPVADGAVVYARGCAASNCHGADGDAGSGPNLSSEVPGRSDSSLTRIIREGAGSMPAVTVTDEELADLLAYLRATFP